MHPELLEQATNLFENIKSFQGSEENSEKYKGLKELLDKLVTSKAQQCGKCKNLCNNLKACENCMKMYLEERFKEWTSDDKQIDKQIEYHQKNFLRPDIIVEWIPYGNLRDIQYVSEVGFYFKIKAIWAEGRYMSWDYEEQEIKRFGPQSVTIKYINMNNSDQEQWFYEISAHLKLTSTNSSVIRTYGVTKDDNSNNYMIVTENVTYDLRKFLRNKATALTWKQKYRILLEILNSLASVHKNKLIHGDIHSGVIWFSTSREIWLIGDFRYCRPLDNPPSDCYGTKPYVAPEVLKDPKKTSFSSDIYSFGILMWEVSTGIRPENFGLDDDEDSKIKLEIAKGTPKRYSNIMKECWNDDPNKRPNLEDIQSEIKSILEDYYKNNMSKDEYEQMGSTLGNQFNIRNNRNAEDDTKPNEGVNLPSIDIIEQNQIMDEKPIDETGRITYATLSSNRVVIKNLQIDKSQNNQSVNSRLPSSLRQQISEKQHIFQNNHIVKFLGIGIRDEDKLTKLFLVMPIANGGNLRCYLKTNKILSLNKKIGIAKDVANGIDTLHQEGIIHENINPTNILIFDGTAKIANIPLKFEKPFENKVFRSRDLNSRKDLFDNIGYIDPNSFLKGHNGGYSKGAPVDIYSFGTLLWEIMSEKIPYSNDFVESSKSSNGNGGILKLIKEIKKGRREKLESAGDIKFPNEYIELYTKCWDANGEVRPTIKEVSDTLKNLN